MAKRNARGGVMNSYFPDEIYNFEECDDKLPLFVEMLKNRGYYIGEDNHIRSKKGTLSSKLMRNGYYMTSAQYDGKTYYFMEHRVIWVWHNGAIPAGLVINHKDYNRANNAIENLELLTQKENTEYSRCHQNPPRGEKSGKALLTNKQASAIKTVAHVCGWSPSVIERVLGVKAMNASRIAKGERYPDAVVWRGRRTYRHLQKDTLSRERIRPNGTDAGTWRHPLLPCCDMPCYGHRHY